MVDQVQYKQYTELDIQNIKQTLRTHLENQDELKDFNFEGSVVDVILNLLSTNNQYMAYYLNMLASEKFIATAQKRESVVGSANNIGYVPYSKKSSTALLSFNITPSDGYTSSILIPKNVKFTTTIDGTTYSFLTTQNTTVIPTISGYNVTNLEVKEGRYFSFKFTIGATDKFLQIPNRGVDTKRITVTVKQSSSDSNAIEYTEYTSLVDLGSLSEVYYIQEGNNGLYEIYFGDGILGKSLSIGNEVTIEYFTTNGNLANNAKVFVLDDEVTGLSSIDFTNINFASGGAMEESIDSIRLSAPTNYQAQDRATTESDYEILIKKIYPDAKQVTAIGGQRYIPRQYGKVFISILKNDLNILSDKDKSDILLEFNKRYAGLTIIAEIVDPYITRMLIDSNVKYSNTGISESEIKTITFNTIKNFVSTDLNSFNFTLRKSKFDALIDNSNKNILSNMTNLRLYIDTNDTIIQTKSNLLNFGQAIQPKLLTSTIFSYKTLPNCEFLDVDGSGFVSVYTKSTGGDLILVNKNTLSIDYNTGILKYLDNNYSLHSLSLENTSGIRVIVKTLLDDIKATNTNVIYVKDDDITILASVE